MEQSFYFYANPFQPRGEEAARTLYACLTAQGAKIYAHAYLAQRGIGTEAAPAALPRDVRAVVAFGGDGTLLRVAADVARQGTALLGVHTGTVGFLMAGDADAPKETAEALLKPDYFLSVCPMLEIRFGGKRYLALNDLALTRGEHPGVIEVLAQADGEQIFCSHGDGMVVSTPLGSTAYALAAGGPVIRPDTPCMLVTPLNARELLQRPVILPLGARVTLLAHGRDRRRLQLAVDGQILLPVTEEARVEICLAREQTRLLVPPDRRFFTTLRKKQALWNQQEEQE